VILFGLIPPGWKQGETPLQSRCRWLHTQPFSSTFPVSRADPEPQFSFPVLFHCAAHVCEASVCSLLWFLPKHPLLPPSRGGPALAPAAGRADGSERGCAAARSPQPSWRRDQLIAPASLRSGPSAAFWTLAAFLSSCGVQLPAQLRSRLPRQDRA